MDNSVSAGAGLRYLEEWTVLARALDLLLGTLKSARCWRLTENGSREKIGLLMGARDHYRSSKALLEAVQAQATQLLDRSFEPTKD